MTSAYTRTTWNDLGRLDSELWRFTLRGSLIGHLPTVACCYRRMLHCSLQGFGAIAICSVAVPHKFVVSAVCPVAVSKDLVILPYAPLQSSRDLVLPPYALLQSQGFDATAHGRIHHWGKWGTFPNRILTLKIYWGISLVKIRFRPDIDPLTFDV